MSENLDQGSAGAMVTNHYDIVIVGGGLVGASLCLAFAGTAKAYGLSIALLDAAPIAATTPSAAGALDGRATALALGSRNLLQSIGLWQHLSPHAQAISNIQVSDQGQPWKSEMQASDMQQEALGYVLQNQTMGQVFLEQITQRCSDFVDLIDQAQVTAIDNARQNSQLKYQRLGQSGSLTAQLIVMADGGRSDLRQQLGMFDQVHNYAQVALVANVQLDQPHGGLACERFTPSGPLALLPLPSIEGKHRAALVWTQPIARQRELQQLTDAELLQEIQQQVGYPMGQLLAIGDRQVYPLALSVAQEQARQGLAVVGNAAHTLHPIAGQGFNLALRGSFTLAQSVLKACTQGLPIGDLANLNQFVKTSRWDQNRVISASDKVMKLFSSDRCHYSVVRQLGLLTMQQVPLVNTIFTRAAMGLDVPLAQTLAMPAAPTASSNSGQEASS
jgi:2-octaprenyl-6-methoxyphenol hydroxylase|tara:strand:+ start:3688 stop:5025 length:1338 start_codon:yes stop_codon:yes gene_type:complete